MTHEPNREEKIPTYVHCYLARINTDRARLARINTDRARLARINTDRARLARTNRDN